MSVKNAETLETLQKLPGVGPATARDLVLLGIHRQQDLRGRKPRDLYEELCAKTGARHDPCVVDVFASLISHAEGQEYRPWWEFTPLRKAGKL